VDKLGGCGLDRGERLKWIAATLRR